MPHFTEIEQYNQKLLTRHEKKAAELHYKKQIPIGELFEEDRKALLMLPPKKFNVCRYEWLKADGYVKVCMEGKRFYSTMPENANQTDLHMNPKYLGHIPILYIISSRFTYPERSFRFHFRSRSQYTSLQTVPDTGFVETADTGRILYRR